MEAAATGLEVPEEAVVVGAARRQQGKLQRRAARALKGGSGRECSARP